MVQLESIEHEGMYRKARELDDKGKRSKKIIATTHILPEISMSMHDSIILPYISTYSGGPLL